MAIPGDWVQSQQNRITFVMIDGTGNEVSGIGDGNLTIEISKNGGAFVGGGGTDTEISDGWYTYLATAPEADTVGPVSVKVDGAGAIQQNLEYVVKQRTPNAVAYTYTVTRSDTGDPIPGAEIWVTTDIAGTNTIWRGTTDAFGVARDVDGNLPLLDPGTYYFWKQISGFTDDDNPDTEVVS
jgi:hypothetical protein